MSKTMIFDTEARAKLLSGVEKAAAAIRITMGPKGRNVVLEKDWGSPAIINDGVSIAKQIDLEDPYENLGAKLIIEVATKTNEISGDGTSTATVLAHEIYKEGLRSIATGISSIAIKRGIEKAVKAVVEELKNMKKDISTKEEITNIASISANNDEEIGMIIADAMEKVGKDGIVTIEESKTAETKVEITEGLEFDQGYISPYLANNPATMEAIYDDVRVLVSEDKLDNIEEAAEILYAMQELAKPVIIIAEDFSTDVLGMLVVNKVKQSIPVVAVKTPGFGDRKKEMAEDIAILTGAVKVSTQLGRPLKGFDFSGMGVAKRVIVGKFNTIIVGGSGDKEELGKRIDYLKKMKEENESEYDAQRLQERISKLLGGVAILSVGANTQTELAEKKLRVEDALNATRAAIAEGIVAGGGTALAIARKAIKFENITKEEGLGAQIIYNALTSPLKQIATNAGINGEVALNEIENHAKNPTDYIPTNNYGLNAATGEYVDLFAAGVIDPTKVTRAALENAASISSMMLTTECLIVKKRSGNKKEQERPEEY